MSGIPKPTDTDLARDAAADLAVADAATPGPWRDDLDDKPRYVWGEIEGPNGGLVCTITQHGNVNTVTRRREEFSHADARFISSSRTALPAWIRRAADAERRVAELEAESARLRGLPCDTLVTSATTPGIVSPNPPADTSSATNAAPSAASSPNDGTHSASPTTREKMLADLLRLERIADAAEAVGEDATSDDETAFNPASYTVDGDTLRQLMHVLADGKYLDGDPIGGYHTRRLSEAEGYAAELEAEVARLQRQVEGHCDRIAEQSELLSRAAEKSPDAALLAAVLPLLRAVESWERGSRLPVEASPEHLGTELRVTVAEMRAAKAAVAAAKGGG